MKIIFKLFISLTFFIVISPAATHPFEITEIVEGLNIPWQIDLTHEGKIFVSERVGKIKVIKDKKIINFNWASIKEIASNGEGGLLGLVLHPDFKKNGYVYLSYNYKKKGQLYNKLVRYQENKGKGVFNKTLLDNILAAHYHNGGRLKFDKNKNLYWAIGDALKKKSAQDLNQLTGKILRLDDEGGIPPDNPFKNSYIFSYGHRNVQGLAFHKNGSLIATEHGPSGFLDCCRDEINLIVKGANYGWPLIRGDQKKAGLKAPLIHSGNEITWAPSGVTFVTKGKWKDSLLFVGLRGQSLYRVVFYPNKFKKVKKIENYFNQYWGRLRDIYRATPNEYYLLTNNLSKNGRPNDKIIKLTLKE